MYCGAADGSGRDSEGAAMGPRSLESPDVTLLRSILTTRGCMRKVSRN